MQTTRTFSAMLHGHCTPVEDQMLEVESSIGEAVDDAIARAVAIVSLTATVSPLVAALAFERPF